MIMMMISEYPFLNITVIIISNVVKLTKKNVWRPFSSVDDNDDCI